MAYLLKKPYRHSMILIALSCTMKLIQSKTKIGIYVYSYLILFVVFTDRNGNTRIISARKATSDEEEFYYENIRRTFE